MRTSMALLLCVILMSGTSVFASTKNSNSYDVVYDGGSIQNVKAGSDLKLFIDPTAIRFEGGKTLLETIPASTITEISYGQDVHRRVGSAIALGVLSFGLGALLMFAKSKKHFIGVVWANGDKKGGMAMQCGKNEYRGILAGLEGVSGKKAVDSTTMGVKN